jgi:hypothetical protein
MTYQEAAAALRMTPESIRARARREHWRKQLGNDGKALILVPVDAEGIPAGDDDCEVPASRPVKRPEPDPVIMTLQARVSDLESRAIDLSAQVERERSERLQERERANRLTDEIAALARQLASTVDDAAGRERDLQGQLSRAKEEAAASTARIDAMKAELEAIQSRSWWRRLVG